MSICLGDIKEYQAKVQDGCRYRCSYCIVTLARGEECSKPLTDIIAEIQRLQTQGIQEIVLAGVHLGGYGSDSRSNLKQLVETVPMLVEGNPVAQGGKFLCSGYTPNYLRVHFLSERKLENQIVDVTLTQFDGGHLQGTLIE